MKRRFIVIAMGLSLAVSSIRGDQILNFIEHEEGHFAVLLNNQKWPHAHVSTNGESYVITLDQGYSFVAGAFPVEIDEPGSPPVFFNGQKIGIFTNFIHVEEEDAANGIASFMDWESEGQTPAQPSHNNPFTTMGPGVTGPNGEMFTVRLFDMPEPSSTLSLLGIGLAGLAWFARIRRTAT
jgi:hypothetical protein